MVFVISKIFVASHFRLVKTVLSVVTVKPRCLLISVKSVDTSPVSTDILTTVKNVEYAGELLTKTFSLQYLQVHTCVCPQPISPKRRASCLFALPCEEAI